MTGNENGMLPILLSAQIASEGIRVKIIGLAQGSYWGPPAENMQQFRLAAERMMRKRARELGGEVVIDPELSPITPYPGVGVIISATCRVGALVHDDSEGGSE